MNKQELIDKINRKKGFMSFSGETLSKEGVLKLVSELDEPQKVVVPRFVAEWIEDAKQNEAYLGYAIARLVKTEELDPWFEYNDNVALFARAWLDGYDVEREKLYTVEIPDPNRKGKNRVYLTKDPATGKIFVTKGKFYPKTNKQTWLTESEIRQDFDWAWQAGFAKEVK